MTIEAPAARRNDQSNKKPNTSYAGMVVNRFWVVSSDGDGDEGERSWLSKGGGGGKEERIWTRVERRYIPLIVWEWVSFMRGYENETNDWPWSEPIQASWVMQLDFDSLRLVPIIYPIIHIDLETCRFEKHLSFSKESEKHTLTTPLSTNLMLLKMINPTSTKLSCRATAARSSYLTFAAWGDDEEK